MFSGARYAALRSFHPDAFAAINWTELAQVSLTVLLVGLAFAALRAGRES